MTAYEPTLIAFFDDLASRWDVQYPASEVAARLDTALAGFGVAPEERVLDVGCGTGNLTAALLRRLGPEGRVVAVDLSARMLEKAQANVNDTRVRWVQGALESAALGSERFDRVFCFGVWPHLADPRLAADRILRLLRRHGMLHIWHTAPRTRINAIHSSAGPAVHTHLLAPAKQTAQILSEAGFVVAATVDDEEQYLVSACAPRGEDT